MAFEEKIGGASPSGSFSHPIHQHVVFSRNVLQAVGVTSLPLGALGRYQTFVGYLWP